ncbi:MAG: Ig-like domain-containing protein [Proteobacteria bacterium]|nr:Ig-like domain-containing protein [Pseudomonadota bacterium]
MIALLSNVSDPQGASMTPHVTAGPSHGGLAWSGTSFNYTPSGCYAGADSFNYYVTENVLGQPSGTVTVSITVNPGVPSIAGIANINGMLWYVPTTVNVSGVAAGFIGPPITVTATSSNPALLPNPTVTYTSPNPTGTLTLTPKANAFTNAANAVTITVTVKDACNNAASTNFTTNIPFGALTRRGW